MKLLNQGNTSHLTLNGLAPSVFAEVTMARSMRLLMFVVIVVELFIEVLLKRIVYLVLIMVGNLIQKVSVNGYLL